MRTAGGVLLFLEAIHLMLASPGLSSITEREAEEARPPLLLLMSQADGRWLYVGGVLIVLLACLAITFAAFAMVEALNRVLGVTGSDVVGRLSGLLLAALAMQFVFDGISQGLLRPVPAAP